MQFDIALKDHYMTNSFDESKLTNTELKIIERKENNIYTLEVPEHYSFIQWTDNNNMTTKIHVMDNDKLVLETHRHPFFPDLFMSRVY